MAREDALRAKRQHILTDDECFTARKRNGNLGAHAPECFRRKDRTRTATTEGAPTN